MAVLSAKQRKSSATVVVGGKPKFPIPDKNHAIAAQGRINQATPPLTPPQRSTVQTAEARFGVGPKAKAPIKKGK